MRALKSWYTDKGPEQGFRRWLAHMDLTGSLVRSMARAKRKGNNSLRASFPWRSGGNSQARGMKKLNRCFQV